MRELIKKALWPVLPKPWETADMEFHYGLWNGVSALYSDGGRQLGEENTRPFALNHHLPAETINCKYPGSREGRAINMSALRTAMQNFDAALAITAAVDRFQRSQSGAVGPAGILDLFIKARASIALVAYQQRYRGNTSRRQAKPPARVSDALTSQYQFISGVFMICRHMMENGHPAMAENRHLCAEALYSYADEHGIFVSFNGMACAGSVKKIMEFLEFCIAGDGPEANLDEIVVEPDKWFQYALATVEMDCFVDAERALQKACADSDEGAIGGSAEIFREVGAQVRNLMRHPPSDDGSVSFRQRAVLRQNAILELLGRPRIKSLSNAHFAKRME